MCDKAWNSSDLNTIRQQYLEVCMCLKMARQTCQTKKKSTSTTEEKIQPAQEMAMANQ